jgi:hypothetical protein
MTNPEKLEAIKRFQSATGLSLSTINEYVQKLENRQMSEERIEKMMNGIIQMSNELEKIPSEQKKYGECIRGFVETLTGAFKPPSLPSKGTLFER